MADITTAPPKPQTKAERVRASLLSAAGRVVEARGAKHLTLDAVAAEAGMSKGGVLYHFPNKRALLSGMLEHMLTLLHLDDPDVQLEDLLRFQLATVMRERGLSMALLAAIAEDPALLGPAVSHMERIFSTVEQDERSDGLMLLLAIEGLRSLDMLSLIPGGDAQRSALGERLKGRIDGMQS